MSIIRSNDEKTLEIDIQYLLKVLLNKITSIILVTLIFGLIAYLGIYYRTVPKYEASVTMYVNNKANIDSITSVSQSDLNASVRLVGTYSAIIKNVSVLRDVIEDSGVEVSEGYLRAFTYISTMEDTEVFMVTVAHPDPKMAARLANSIANVAPKRIAEIVDGSSVKIINYADIPSWISSPNYKKSTVLGMLMGAIVSIVFIVVKELLDTTIKSESDFAQWNYPILSTIPDLEASLKNKRYGYGSYGHKKQE